MEIKIVDITMKVYFFFILVITKNMTSGLTVHPSRIISDSTKMESWSSKTASILLQMKDSSQPSFTSQFQSSITNDMIVIPTSTHSTQLESSSKKTMTTYSSHRLDRTNQLQTTVWDATSLTTLTKLNSSPKYMNSIIPTFSKTLQQAPESTINPTRIMQPTGNSLQNTQSISKASRSIYQYEDSVSHVGAVSSWSSSVLNGNPVTINTSGSARMTSTSSYITPSSSLKIGSSLAYSSVPQQTLSLLHHQVDDNIVSPYTSTIHSTVPLTALPITLDLQTNVQNHSSFHQRSSVLTRPAIQFTSSYLNFSPSKPTGSFTKMNEEKEEKTMNITSMESTDLPGYDTIQQNQSLTILPSKTITIEVDITSMVSSNQVIEPSIKTVSSSSGVQTTKHISVLQTSLTGNPNSSVSVILTSNDEVSQVSFDVLTNKNVSESISTASVTQIVHSSWNSTAESDKFFETSPISNFETSTTIPYILSSNVISTESWMKTYLLSSMRFTHSLTKTVDATETSSLTSTLATTVVPIISSKILELELFSPHSSASYNLMPTSTHFIKSSSMSNIQTPLMSPQEESMKEIIIPSTTVKAEDCSNPLSSSTQYKTQTLVLQTQHSKSIKSTKTLSASSTLSADHSRISILTPTPSTDSSLNSTKVIDLTNTTPVTHGMHKTDPIVHPSPTTLPYNTTFEITFLGKCAPLNNSHTYHHFTDNVQSLICEKLSLETQYVIVHNLTCASVHIHVTLLNVVIATITKHLKDLIESKEMNITVYGMLYVGVAFKTVPTPTFLRDYLSVKYEKNTEVIVIIIASTIIVVLVLVGLIVFGRECYRRKHSQSFDLTNTPHVHMKMEDFTLTRIPRSSTWYSDEGIAIQRFSDTNGGSIVKSSNGLTKQPTISCISDILKDKDSSNAQLRQFSYSILPNNNRKDSQDTTVSAISDGNFGHSTDSLVAKHNSSMHGAVNPIYLGDELSKIAATLVSDQRPNHTERQTNGKAEI